MKKYAIIYFILLIIGANAQLIYTHNQVQADQPAVIPDEAIRLRILANSDGEKDQYVKRLIRDRVNEQITEWVKDLTSVTVARKTIKENLPALETIAKEVLKEEGVNESVHVKFGKVEFPTKLYGQFLYPAGEYEAVLITLGKGEGANWWCVLFPPLCFLDFSNGEAVKAPEPSEEEPTEEKEKPAASESKSADKTDDKSAESKEPAVKTEIQSATITSDSIEQKAGESSQSTVSSKEVIAKDTSSTVKEETSAKAEKKESKEAEKSVSSKKKADSKSKEDSVEVKFFVVEWVSSVFN
ncbi:stage II sporulation protein R [Priestia megaterium]|uniref:stage II sporulation protein R n=1 Tax=Priestia megaterium TaxID=1404 RepID=UPI000BFD5A3A|nr:stage II sporulation protein R [Priestia megaterium]MEB2293836.1 stage II sporulation protein R [Priestia megaterium]MED4059864.1 stage II sporulation protein R [Priestia megaterium]PGK27268.1 stage II sporulation protein R [Priestia megaterium]PNE05084.1 stage II sporulation protein R [Priestia megaterium]